MQVELHTDIPEPVRFEFLWKVKWLAGKTPIVFLQFRQYLIGTGRVELRAGKFPEKALWHEERAQRIQEPRSCFSRISDTAWVLFRAAASCSKESFLVGDAVVSAMCSGSNKASWRAYLRKAQLPSKMLGFDQIPRRRDRTQEYNVLIICLNRSVRGRDVVGMRS